MSQENTASTGDTGENKENKETQAQNSESSAVKDEKTMIPKSRFDQVNQQRKEAIDHLEKIATEFVETVPEDMRNLIPALGPVEKINWIRNATAAGIFTKNAPTNGPDTKRPGTKVPLNLDSLPSSELRKMGYKNS
jgi:hypothetical protein